MSQGTHRGFDASHHNATIDFGTAKRAGVELVALKATEGAGYTDPTFADRWARARLVGFRRTIAYHFVRPLDDPRVQALHFAHVVGTLQPGEMLALDVETVTSAPGEDWNRLSALRSRNVVIQTLEALKGAMDVPAARVLLYGSPGWLRGQFGPYLRDLTVMPLWAARYASALGDVSPWPKATIWQDSEHGTVPGVSSPGQVDTDLWLDAGAWA